MGLDIGSSAVKVVEIVPRGDGGVAIAGWSATPADSIIDGAITEPEAVAGAIRQAVVSAGIRTRRVAVALPANAVIVKRIELPPMPEARLGEAVTQAAAQQLMFDPDDVHLDYHRMGAGAPGADDPIDVMVVAARRATVAPYLGVTVEAGCTPSVVDVGPFALQNAHEWTHGGKGVAAADSAPDASIALIDVGASATTVSVVRAGVPLFTRAVPAGGNTCTDALERELYLGSQAAERLKRGVPTGRWTQADAVPVVREAADALALEVRQTLALAEAGPVGDTPSSIPRLDRILLTGGASRASGLEEMLRAHIGVSVERFDPFRRLTLKGPAASDPVVKNELVASAGIAVGLAVRSLGGIG